MKQPDRHLFSTDNMNSNSTFELDLLHFHGEALALDFEIPGAEAGWVLEDAAIPARIDEDAPFHTELRAQLVGSTLYIDGTVKGSFWLRCGRCLQWRRIDLDEEVEFVLMSRASWEDAYHDKDEIVLEEHELNVSYYDDEIVDLRPLIREAILLELPEFPTCPPSMKSACDAAYQDEIGRQTLQENESNSIDLRWSKLKDIDLSDDG